MHEMLLLKPQSFAKHPCGTAAFARDTAKSRS